MKMFYNNATEREREQSWKKGKAKRWVDTITITRTRKEQRVSASERPLEGGNKKEVRNRDGKKDTEQSKKD